MEEKGSIALSEAICLTHKIDISDRYAQMFFSPRGGHSHHFSARDFRHRSRKYFVEPFIDSVKALALANGTAERIAEFKRFVNEFGTHYSSTSEMGTKLSVERRYSSKERNSAGVDELKRCNTASGAKVLGFQAEVRNIRFTNQ